MPRVSAPRLLPALAAVVAFAALLVAPAAASAAPQSSGLMVHLLWSGVTDAEMDRQLDAVKESGARVIRVDAGWQTVEEAGKGQWSQWYLQKMDSVVAKAEARGIRVLFTLMWTPCWASSAPDSVKQNCSPGWVERGVNAYPPTNVNDYADALRFLATRYKGRVAAWEIWNEPNLKHFWNSASPASDYARLLKAAYPVAKASDPGAVVLGGSIAESDVPFTEALYANGIKGSFDVFSSHPYSHDYSPTIKMTGASVLSSFISGVPAVHDVMVRNGDPKPMWLTEFGWSTSAVRGQEMWVNGVDETVQAEYLRQAYEIMRTWDFVEVGMWFGLRNWNTNATERDANYGLLRFDHSRKPSYAAFQAASATLGSPAVAPAPAPEPAPVVTAPAPTKKAPTKGKRRLMSAGSLRAATSCRNGRLRVSGRARSGSRVRVQLFRARAFRGRRVTTRAAYTRVVRATKGRFRVTPPRGALRGCRYALRVAPVKSTPL